MSAFSDDFDAGGDPTKSNIDFPRRHSQNVPISWQGCKLCHCAPRLGR
jgi:hypothetical protein